MRNNRNVVIEWGGRRYHHQQAQALMRAVGEMGEIRVACHYGAWRCNLHHGQINGVGHGKTMWAAIKDTMDRATANTRADRSAHLVRGTVEPVVGQSKLNNGQ